MYKGIPVEVIKLKSLGGRNFDMVTCEIKYKGTKIISYQDDGNGGCPHLDILGPIVKDGKGGYKKSKERIRNIELYKELQEKLQATEGAMGCLEDTMGLVVEEAMKIKEAKTGIMVRQADETYTYSVLRYKAGSIATCIKKWGKEKAIATFEAEMKKQMAAGAKILCQDYYVSIGVNKEIFTQS